MYGALMQPTGKWMRWCFCIRNQFKITKGWTNIIFEALHEAHNAFLFLFTYHDHIIITISLLIVHCLLVLMQILWRVDGTKGTIQIERGIDSGKHGYQVKNQFFC
jgi:hypothetical protein